jgi:hypothetical protein
MRGGKPNICHSLGLNETITKQIYEILITHGAEPFLRSCQWCSYSRTSQHFMEPETSLPCSQEPSTGPYPEPDQSNPSLKSFIQRVRPGPRLLVFFRNDLIFYGEELLAPRPTPQLEDHPFSTIHDSFFIYSQLPSISGGRLLRPQPVDAHAPCRGDKAPT